jgi:hypothetical protein
VPFILLFNKADEAVRLYRDSHGSAYQAHLLELLREKCTLVNETFSPLLNCLMSSMITNPPEERDVLVFNESLSQLFSAYSAYRLLSNGISAQSGFTLDDAIRITQGSFTKTSLSSEFGCN